MSKIIFMEHNGTAHEVDLKLGKSLMQLAIDNAIPNIDADCGGECACGTCHVILSAQLAALCDEPTEQEQQMLAMNLEKSVYSRLSCQVKVLPNMAGMVVQLPEYQM